MEGGTKQMFKKMVKTIYTRTLVSKSVSLEMKYIGANIRDVLEEKVKTMFEGKCCLEGFVKTDSIKVINYSSGLIKGSNVLFEVTFECQTAFPVEGQLIHCVAKNITKAGIRGESMSENPSPFIVFIARDHQVENPLFADVKEGETFMAKVIGQRFELNDTYISIIAELVNISKYKV
jgi:DNA-directed RNA polymerase subunit E'/Rpb7